MIARRMRVWRCRADWSFGFAGAMVATGELNRARLWARAGWCYAHRLYPLGDWFWWLAGHGMRAHHWQDIATMAEYHRIDRRKGLALVGMAK